MIVRLSQFGFWVLGMIMRSTMLEPVPFSACTDLFVARPCALDSFRQCRLFLSRVLKKKVPQLEGFFRVWSPVLVCLLL